MSPRDACWIEFLLKINPGDVGARSKLIGYYALNNDGRSFSSQSADRHIIWLVRHDPHAAILGVREQVICSYANPFVSSEFDRVWSDQADQFPNDPTIAGRAGEVLITSDPARAERLLSFAASHERSNSRWAGDLVHVYDCMMEDAGQTGKPAAARRVIIATDRYLSFDLSPDDRWEALCDAAIAAIACQSLDKANEYAAQVLSIAGGDANAIHHAHLIFGRTALRRGNAKEAGAQLLAAARVHGSPELGSFGPNMQLAKEMLDHGHRKVVLQYFHLCSAFWDTEDLHQWSKEVRSGRKPDFRANLVY
jgi:hypothetical protein